MKPQESPGMKLDESRIAEEEWTDVTDHMEGSSTSTQATLLNPNPKQKLPQLQTLISQTVASPLPNSDPHDIYCTERRKYESQINHLAENKLGLEKTIYILEPHLSPETSHHVRNETTVSMFGHPSHSSVRGGVWYGRYQNLSATLQNLSGLIGREHVV